MLSGVVAIKHTATGCGSHTKSLLESPNGSPDPQEGTGSMFLLKGSSKRHFLMGLQAYFKQGGTRTVKSLRNELLKQQLWG